MPQRRTRSRRHEELRTHKLLPTESSCAELRRITFCGDSFPVASGSSGQEQHLATPNQAGRYNRLASLFQGSLGSVPFPESKSIPIPDILANFCFSSSVAKTSATTPLATDRIDFFLHGVNIFSQLPQRSRHSAAPQASAEPRQIDIKDVDEICSCGCLPIRHRVLP
jgi:hypothetical protein